MRRDDGAEIVVGEARYVLNEETGRTELALSIGDAMQRRGLGKQLLANLECRAVAAGGQELFGDTLRSNEAMIALARSLGYALIPTPGEWKQVRFEKARHLEAGLSLRKSAARCGGEGDRRLGSGLLIPCD